MVFLSLFSPSHATTTPHRRFGSFGPSSVTGGKPFVTRQWWFESNFVVTSYLLGCCRGAGLAFRDSPRPVEGHPGGLDVGLPGLPHQRQSKLGPSATEGLCVRAGLSLPGTAGLFLVGT